MASVVPIAIANKQAAAASVVGKGVRTSGVRAAAQRRADDDKSAAMHTFKRLNEITPLELHESVNVYAIISDINECTTVYRKGKPPISLRRFSVVDESEREMNVAMWGLQAENFAHNVGDLIMFLNVKVTDFKGLVLSVEWKTKMMEIDESLQIDAATRLRQWWIETRQQNTRGSTVAAAAHAALNAETTETLTIGNSKKSNSEIKSSSQLVKRQLDSYSCDDDEKVFKKPNIPK